MKMTDRFRFRAKRCDNNRFVYGYLVFIYIDNHKKARIYCPDDTFSYDVYTDTLGQCTGLKDKNGKLIYEGDIVSKEFTDRPFSSKAKSEIKNCLMYWDNGDGAFSLKYKSDDYRCYSAHHNNPFGDCEIIGNIHENPDLLED
jgi:uncharacterized phage protein (TIGR01671 family)